MLLQGPAKFKGYSLIEVVLSAAILSLLGTVFTYAVIYGQETKILASRQDKALLLAKEGIEVVKNIRNENFNNLVDGQYGLILNNNIWEFTQNFEQIENFERQIIISSIDPNTKQIESVVNWQQNLQRTGTVVLKTNLTNWK
jgi:type II secretory pathway pseudopilin PulG